MAVVDQNGYCRRRAPWPQAIGHKVAAYPSLWLCLISWTVSDSAYRNNNGESFVCFLTADPIIQHVWRADFAVPKQDRRVVGNIYRDNPVARRELL